MAKLKIQGNDIDTIGDVLKVGDKAYDFKLTTTDLKELSLTDITEQKVVLNIFTSLDTGVCAASVRKFNEIASNHSDTKVLCISRDLPFAQARFCGAEGIDNVVTLSEMRDRNFGKDYGLELISGPTRGLLARSVIVLNKERKVIYTELVEEVTNEPNYEKALEAIEKY